MEYYTVRQIAELLDVSKPTVQKVINQQGIDADHIEKNKVRCYNVEQTKAIIAILKPDFDLSILSPSTENTAKMEGKTAKFIEKSPTDQEAIMRMLEMLQAEIDKKDREIQNRDKRIETLENRLIEQTQTIEQLAKQASYITAADKTAQIMDKQQEQEEKTAANAEQQEQKKKKFHFLWWK